MINKKLVFTLRALEVFIQSIFFMSITVLLYCIAVGTDAAGVFACVLIFVPVLFAYLTRKFIHKYVRFVVCNFLFAIGSLFVGATMGQHSFYFVTLVIIAGYSIRLKMVMMQKNDITQIPLYDEVLDEVEKEKNLQSMQSGEQLPLAFFVFMIVGYMVGHAFNSTAVMDAQVILCVLYILFQILYNDLSRLNTLYIRNADKSEFPAKQIKNVNTVIIVGTMLLVLVGMVVFYNGRYGNSFSIIGSGLLTVFRAVMKFLIYWSGRGGKTNTGSVDVTEATTEKDSYVETETYQTNELAETAAEIFVVLLITAAVVGIVYMAITYIKQFNKARRMGADYVESVKDEAKRKKAHIQQNNRSKKDAKAGKNNTYARKLYKKKVLEGCEESGKPDPTKAPNELTKATITKDVTQAEQITEIYEKARYSDEKITNEEIDLLKNTKKNL